MLTVHGTGTPCSLLDCKLTILTKGLVYRKVCFNYKHRCASHLHFFKYMPPSSVQYTIDTTDSYFWTLENVRRSISKFLFLLIPSPHTHTHTHTQQPILYTENWRQFKEQIVPHLSPKIFLWRNLHIIIFIYIYIYIFGGHAVTQLVEALPYKPEGRGVQFPMVSLEFFIDIIFLAALWPWGWLSL